MCGFSEWCSADGLGCIAVRKQWETLGWGKTPAFYNLCQQLPSPRSWFISRWRRKIESDWGHHDEAEDGERASKNQKATRILKKSWLCWLSWLMRGKQKSLLKELRLGLFFLTRLQRKSRKTKSCIWTSRGYWVLVLGCFASSKQNGGSFGNLFY